MFELKRKVSGAGSWVPIWAGILARLPVTFQHNPGGLAREARALAAFDCPDGTLTEAGAKNACANEVSPVATGPEDVFWRTRDGPAGRLYGVCEEYWPVI